MPDPTCPFVSRGGLKLQAALQQFQINPENMVCADLGCNVGGFTDCLLQQNASKLYSVDTGYGPFAWKLRQNPLVTTLERTNALHFDPTTLENFQPCDLVVIDLGWTRQKHAIPAALKWLKPNSPDTTTSGGVSGGGGIISLIKPHYESDQSSNKRIGDRGVLDEEESKRILQITLDEMPTFGVQVINHIQSPIKGGKSKGRTGNIEYLAHLQPIQK